MKLVNLALPGMQIVRVEELYNKEIETDEYIVVLDESCVELDKYYHVVLGMIHGGSRVFVIAIQDKSPISDAIFRLMASYRHFDMYVVDSKEVIGMSYVDKIKKRTPSALEVSMYISGECMAYSEISTVLIGIRSLVIDGDIEGLKKFIGDNAASIDSMVSAVEYMRAIVDTSNYRDKDAELIKTSESLDIAQAEIKKLSDSKKLLENEVKSKDMKVKEVEKQLSETKKKAATSSSGAGAIRNYAEFNTKTISCKVANVIYFKEISPIPYINSLVTNLFDAMKIMGVKAKLLIYDNKGISTAAYRPLNVIGSTEYVADRQAYAGKKDKFVVVEPNVMILDDIMKGSYGQYDVVIVYDRMKQLPNLIAGNNVVQFWVLSSKKEYNELKATLHINSVEAVITRPDCYIGDGQLDILTVPNYSNSSNSSKLTKYTNLKTSRGDKLLLESILKRARVSR